MPVPIKLAVAENPATASAGAAMPSTAKTCSRWLSSRSHWLPDALEKKQRFMP